MPVMENIRQGANSPVMKLLFGAIVIVFVFWGIGGQRQTQTIATVNGTRITDTPLQKELRANTRGMALTKQQQASLEENIIVQLIREQLLLEEAEKIGLHVSDYEVAIAIMQDPSFHDADGMFSKKLMDQALQMNGWREDRFEADLRQRILLSKVQQSVIYGVNVSDAELKQQFMTEQTSMSVRWVMLSPDLLKDDVPVTDEAIDAVLASEEDKVRSRYESEKARRWSQPRKIQYATILLRTDLTEEQGQMPEEALRSRLETILSEARSGADFADLARQYSEDLTAARGGEQGMRREDQVDAELAKALAEFMFDDDQNIVRIDMSEYMEKHTVARLIGAPPGYVGFDEGGQLTEAVRRRPYSVVLFDEIEKAHPDVFNILLQVLDDGRLTDSKGRTVDFKNTVMIMTSNIGARRIMDAGSDREKAVSGVMEELRRTLKPEFLNRIDDVIVFDALTRENMDFIFDIQLKRVGKLLAQRDLLIEVTNAARTALCDAGFDPTFGARPLKRAIQQYLLNPMSKAIVGGDYGMGDTVKVALEEDRITFERIPAPEEDALMGEA